MFEDLLELLSAFNAHSVKYCSEVRRYARQMRRRQDHREYACGLGESAGDGDGERVGPQGWVRFRLGMRATEWVSQSEGYVLPTAICG